MTGLLDDLTVLDFTRVLAGPYCTRLLADLGARVIKIERPGEGDEMRRGFLQLEAGRNDQATYFVRINAGKQSVALDLAHPLARDVVRDLTLRSDVAVENFVPGVVARLGCDYPTLAGIKPDLVYCSISGFGQTGPLRSMQAFAHIIQAISGIMHLEQGGDPEPRVNYLQTADVLAGTQAFGAIMAALWRRARTGQGAYLDVAMLECLVAAEDVTFGSVLNGGEDYPGPRPGMVIHTLGDRALAMQTVGAPQLWPRLLEAMKRPDLASDPRFATPPARREHWPDLRAIVLAWLDTFPSVDAALRALGAARLPAAPVLSPREVAAHPHLAEREFFAEVPHPGRGRVRVNAIPFRVDGARPTPAGSAPYRTGEHTRAVLTDVLGYDEQRVETLRKAGAIEIV
ncbi:MAG TPA: CaiB/BaiF CoA-transferase family protein [Methylomirabilota bacterium]|nr:CaiB/BaiF CoA-transferase family protein [Methylomirabilota bacterium]